MLLHVARNQVIGILRKNQVPECVQMEKVTNKGKLLAIKGTTKAAVLVGDPGCPHLVVVTVYDNVPVRFITTAHETIEWTQQWRKAYNRTLQMEARAPPPCRRHHSLV